MNAVVKQTDSLPSIPNEGATVLSMIAKAASDPNVDIDKMERLMRLHKDMKAQQAEQAFNVALNQAQGRMGRVATNQRNAQTGSRYTDYAGLDRVLRPIYTEEGFSLSFDTAPEAPEGCIRVLCHVSHSEGHTRTYQADMPVDGKGAKGNDVMTKTHATGSGMSYGMRYLLKMIFNVAIGETDDDGNKAGGAQQKCVSADEALVLEDLAKTAQADVPAFLALLDNAETFGHVWAKDFKRAKDMLNQKIRVLEKAGKL